MEKKMKSVLQFNTHTYRIKILLELDWDKTSSLRDTRRRTLPFDLQHPVVRITLDFTYFLLNF